MRRAKTPATGRNPEASFTDFFPENMAARVAAEEDSGEKGKVGKQPIRGNTGRCAVEEAPGAHQQVRLEDLRAAQIQILRLFARIERFARKIDEAFAGQPFLPNLAPDAPANRRRFNAYFNEHKEVTKLLSRAVELWMITCGMKREDDWIPLLVEDLRNRRQQEYVNQILKQ